ncbi:hypothetical protein FHE72_23595 (plasmid) [Rossellomorea vietnamensis]|uniref:Uncharacterized protein n=1 Tax=Rossellomorea vietnamensis TaxID=218284 RepID=A0A6I6UPX1_9BACI|nr:hypothetical protein [Rossellomorea vietnamensis]QHE63978.1 hypothetical protein FHE72_23595 [Rossellomorea vietnamensis]
MTNLEKMNQLVGSDSSKEQVVKWAYMNRVHVGELALEKEFESMFNSVEEFCNSQTYVDGFTDESEMWRTFLDRVFIA